MGTGDRTGDWGSRNVEDCGALVTRGSDARRGSVPAHGGAERWGCDGTPHVDPLDAATPEVLPPAVDVTEVRNFFGGDHHAYSLEGEHNLADLIDACAIPNGSVAVFVNGDIQDLAECHMQIMEPGDRVVIRAVPRGDDGPKVAQVFITLIAIIAAKLFPAFAVPIMIGAAAINVGISLAFPPPGLPVAGDPGSIKNASQISGSRNRINMYGAVPVVIGDAVRVFPQLAAQPYTEIEAGTQFIRMIFEVHHGRMENIVDSDMFIGQTPITALEGVKTEVRRGRGIVLDPPSDLFSLDVDEVGWDIQLNAADGGHGLGEWHDFFTLDDATEFSMDITAPGGFGAYTNRGALIGYSVTFELQYRTNFDPPGSWLSMDPDVDDEMGWFADTGAHTVKLTQAHRGLMHRGIRFEFPIVWPNGYHVRIRVVSEAANVGAVGTEDNWLTEVRVSRFRSIKPSQLFADIDNVSTVAIRVKASDQLSGAIDTFNCIVRPQVAEWSPVTGWSDLVGSPYWINTAYAPWHYASILRGPASRTPTPDALIDHVALNEWRSLCVAKGWKVAGVIGNQEQKRYWLEKVAATSRAIPSRINGLYSVIWEKAQTIPVQMFTDRNSRKTSGQMTFIEQPHALRIRFIDKTSNYQAAEREVFADGYSKDGSDAGTVAATYFKEMDMWGITDPAVVMIHGWYHLAAARLRRRQITREVDFENLLANRGDMVLLQDRASLLASDSLRIATVPTTPMAGWRRFAVDANPQIEIPGLQNYRMAIRKGDAVVFITPSDIVWEGTALDPTNRFFQVDVTGITGDAVAKGDLVSLHKTDIGASEMIVTGIAHKSDFTAVVSMSDYAPEIQNADTGTIPEWDSGITNPVNRDTEAPHPPTITLPDGVRSDESVMIFDESGTPIPRIVVSFQLPDTGPIADLIVGQYRLIDEDDNTIKHPWRNAQSTDPHNGQISFFPIEDGALYDLRIRSQSEGKPSTWQLIENHRAIGRTTPPPTPANIDITPGNVIRWTMPSEPADLAGYVIRYKQGQFQDWNTAAPAHEGVISTTQFALEDLPVLPRGQEITIMVAAIDQIGITSASVDGTPEFAWIVTTLTDGILPNVVATNQRDPGFGGFLANCTVSGGDLFADPDTPGFWTGEDGSSFWNSDLASFWADKYLEMAYLAGYTPTPASGTLRLVIDADGDWSVIYAFNGSPLAPWPGLFELPSAGSFVFQITIPAGPVQGVIRTMAWETDVADKREKQVGLLSDGVPGGQIVPPLTAFNTIQQARVTLTGVVGVPPAVAVGAVVHNYGVGALPPGGPLIELLDGNGAVAPINTPFDVEFIGF